MQKLKPHSLIKETDWGPAPEEMASRITSAETAIEQNAYEITQRATLTSVNSLTGQHYVQYHQIFLY